MERFFWVTESSFTPSGRGLREEGEGFEAEDKLFPTERQPTLFAEQKLEDVVGRVSLRPCPASRISWLVLEGAESMLVSFVVMS